MFVQVGLNQRFEASAMNSSDGESVPFIASTILEGPVEVKHCSFPL